jgi:hypothetical protein
MFAITAQTFVVKSHSIASRVLVAQRLDILTDNRVLNPALAIQERYIEYTAQNTDCGKEMTGICLPRPKIAEPNAGKSVAFFLVK